MIKLVIGALVLAVGGVAWLRMQWAVDKNKRAARKIIDGLKNGTYSMESFEESLGMLIRNKKLPDGAEGDLFLQKLKGLPGVNFHQFKVLHVELNENNKGIVIAEGTVKDMLSGSNKEIDVVYPCWLYIEIEPATLQVSFKSSMPDGKDHHYLLEDISDRIFERCIKWLPTSKNLEP